MLKYIVEVTSLKKRGVIRIDSVKDAETKEEVTGCTLRGCIYGDAVNKWGQVVKTSLEDLKEDVNWILNGDSRKYRFKWGMSGKETSDGIAYVYD